MKKNRLEYLKKYSIRFGFDFISLKSKNQTEKIKKQNRKNQTEPKLSLLESKKNQKNNIVFGF
jgi:hypothetical protein